MPQPPTHDSREPNDDAISVVIIAYNEEDYLPRLLDCLLAQTWRRFEIIVVDSNSGDRTREIALEYRNRFESLKLVELPSAQGPGYARNQGALHARHERVLFLDADTTLAPEFLERAIHSLRRKPASLATCFLRVNESGLLSAGGALFLNACMLLLKPVYVTAYGACLFSTKEVHETVGGFNEGLAICEDCDYVNRAVRGHGFRYRILPMRFGASDRRARHEGPLPLFFKYIRVHLRRMFSRAEIEAGKLVYEYGQNRKDTSGK